MPEVSPEKLNIGLYVSPVSSCLPPILLGSFEEVGSYGLLRVSLELSGTSGSSCPVVWLKSNSIWCLLVWLAPAKYVWGAWSLPRAL